jgi:chemotaxis signal transduction protein
MGAARRLKGLTAIGDAVTRDTAAQPAVHVLVLDGVPRTGLTVTEVARITGMPATRIRAEIQRGRIRVIDGGRNYVIPVSELAEIANWAQYMNST